MWVGRAFSSQIRFKVSLVINQSVFSAKVAGIYARHKKTTKATLADFRTSTQCGKRADLWKIFDREMQKWSEKLLFLIIDKSTIFGQI